MAKFHILKNDKGFYWHLKANNGNKICWSGEFYTTKENAEKGIEFVKNFSKNAEVVDDSKKLLAIKLPKPLIKKL